MGLIDRITAAIRAFSSPSHDERLNRPSISPSEFSFNEPSHYKTDQTPRRRRLVSRSPSVSRRRGSISRRKRRHRLFRSGSLNTSFRNRSIPDIPTILPPPEWADSERDAQEQRAEEERTEREKAEKEAKRAARDEEERRREHENREREAREEDQEQQPSRKARPAREGRERRERANHRGHERHRDGPETIKKPKHREETLEERAERKRIDQERTEQARREYEKKQARKAERMRQRAEESRQRFDIPSAERRRKREEEAERVRREEEDVKVERERRRKAEEKEKERVRKDKEDARAEKKRRRKLEEEERKRKERVCAKAAKAKNKRKEAARPAELQAAPKLTLGEKTHSAPRSKSPNGRSGRDQIPAILSEDNLNMHTGVDFSVAGTPHSELNRGIGDMTRTFIMGMIGYEEDDSNERTGVL